MTSNETPDKEVTVVLGTLKNIAEAVILAAEAGTLKQVLQQIAYVAKQLVHSRYAALGVPSEHGTMKYFEVAGLTPDEVQSIAHPPIGRGLLGVIMNEREILRLEHMQDDPRSAGFPENHPYMDRLLGVPVQAGTQLFGMLYLTDRLDDLPFTENDQWLVESLAGYAALAIAGSRLSEQHSRLTLLEERERVGMELHDGIIQSLYAIGMQLQLLRLAKQEVSDDLVKVTHGIDMVIEDIRHYILNLKVANYEQQTIHACLKDVLVRLHIPETLKVQINAPDRQPPFAPPVVEAVCQIAYEAISNIIRHSQATEAVIDVSEDVKQFQMVVRDNGKGFAEGTTSKRGGLGLQNIAQRARIYGGDVKIESKQGAGTRLTLVLPIGKT
ncbi:MAG: GAF domain-containing protein [Chloroflexi bacterium]|nr:GAF domain-containing protein [Chloroflexota bacterium]MCC6891822.1 GAF domain-containing protein [Anaerolineae bacterium]